jgi:drug/metabolite transporter (DMT)-like permease
MLYLLVVSLIWAFSFGLIKTNLASVDPDFVAAARLAVSLLVFLPLFRPRTVDRKTALRLLLTGAVQYGGMYIAYTYSFQYLKAYEVALFTIFTPLYVTLIDDLIQRRLNWVNLATTLMAVAGTWIVKGGSAIQPGVLLGFVIVQVSNLCFAFGQIYYRHVLAGQQVNESRLFALPYLGGFAAAGLSAAIFTDWGTLSISGSQWLTLLYLGAIASGVCFFLWNVGARKVDAGTLAIFNDLKIPTAVVVSLAFFGEQANLLQLALGGVVVVAALALNELGVRRQAMASPVAVK